MAEQHGGMRRPAKPAPVSGPGRLARRTDGGAGEQTRAQMTGMGYGENADFMDIQSSAPLAAAPSVPTTRMRNSPTGQSAAATPTPLFAPSERPEEPVTAGVPFGPGPGPVETVPQGRLADVFRRMAMQGNGDDARELYELAQRLGW